MKRPRHSSKGIVVHLTPGRLGPEKEEGALSSVAAAGMAALRWLNQAFHAASASKRDAWHLIERKSGALKLRRVIRRGLHGELRAIAADVDPYERKRMKLHAEIRGNVDARLFGP